MTLTINGIKTILKNEGILSFIKRFFNYSSKIIYYPYYLINIKNKKAADINSSIDIAFDHGKGIIRPLQVKSEIKELLSILEKKKPKYMMEIGTANGGTLFLFSRTCDANANIISLDLRRGKFGGGYPIWRIPLYKSFAIKNQNIHLVRADSHKKETVKKINNILNGNKLDFLFIDGDHTYEGVKKDFEMYKQLVKKDGIIAFHDIVEHNDEAIGVNKIWNEIKSNYNYKEIIENWNQNWAGIGIILNKI